ncbi:MAG TPA: hypothetical protein PK156_10360 [Polyangium sp.]|nr:hypothetical protein [Polyangium sp.]
MGDERDVTEQGEKTTALVPQSVVLPSGRAIEVEAQADADVLRFRAPSGECVLTIHLTDAGPVVRVAGADLEVRSAKRLSLDCEEFQLRAAKSAAIEVGGDLRERVGGSALRVVRGEAIVEAQHARLEARPGGIELRANDDVRVTGERVLLNSDDPPMPLTWEEYEARRVERESKLLGAGELVAIEK